MAFTSEETRKAPALAAALIREALATWRGALAALRRAAFQWAYRLLAGEPADAAPDMFASVREAVAETRTSLNAEIDARAAKRAKEAELLAETARRRAARRAYMPPAVDMDVARWASATPAPAFGAVANECAAPSRFDWLAFHDSETERRCRARNRAA